MSAVLAPKGARSRQVSPARIDEAVAIVANLSGGAKGVFYTLNPLLREVTPFPF